MTIYDFKVTDIDDKEISMEQYKGEVLLIVNVASICSMTPQYAGLEELYLTHKKDGLKVLCFPTNEFGGKESGSNSDIKKFVKKNYNVTFDMFAKTIINGKNANPLYKYLKGEKKGIFWTEGVKWNFTKFLVDKDGTIVQRYASSVSPIMIEKDIEKLL